MGIGVIFLTAVTCGVVFLLALLRQFGVVEATACIVAGIEVFFFSSSIGDKLEGKREMNWLRLGIAVALAVGVIAYFLVMTLR